jgi:type II secretory pathway component PulJ
LIEILISILIFSVVSLAMVTILLTATNLFRSSERARTASDLALVALSQLDDDFRYMVPPGQHGFFAAEVPTYQNGDGNCLVAFRILQPDRTLVDNNGGDVRQLVCWTVINGVLYRGSCPTSSTQTDFDVLTSLYTYMINNTANNGQNRPLGGVEQVREMARGCLHFGVWISSNGLRRTKDRAWTNAADAANDPLPPFAAIAPAGSTPGAFYCTVPDIETPPITPDPFPESVHISMILGGGTYAPHGTLIQDNGDSLMVAGIGQFPFGPGAKVKIDNEWIGITGPGKTSASVACDPAARTNANAPLLRSTNTTHTRGADVYWGTEFTQTFIVPH